MSALRAFLGSPAAIAMGLSRAVAGIARVVRRVLAPLARVETTNPEDIRATAILGTWGLNVPLPDPFGGTDGGPHERTLASERIWAPAAGLVTIMWTVLVEGPPSRALLSLYLDGARLSRAAGNLTEGAAGATFTVLGSHFVDEGKHTVSATYRSSDAAHRVLEFNALALFVPKSMAKGVTIDLSR